MNTITLREIIHQINWQKLLITLLIWLGLEICLNLLGIDDLIDCTEFLFEKECIVFCCSISN